MTEAGKRPYKQIRLEEAVADAQLKDALATFDEPWQPQKARLQMAGYLAFGLLGLFALTVACSGAVITALVITSTMPNTSGDPTKGIEQMIQFVTTLLPYIATPLGVALGYFFKESKEE